MLDFWTRSVGNAAVQNQSRISRFLHRGEGPKGTEVGGGTTGVNASPLFSPMMMMMITIADETNEATEGGREGEHRAADRGE